MWNLPIAHNKSSERWKNVCATSRPTKGLVLQWFRMQEWECVAVAGLRHVLLKLFLLTWSTTMLFDSHEADQLSNAHQRSNSVLRFSYGPFKRTCALGQVDLPLLQKEHQDNPSDARIVFYLAQTLDLIGESQPALDMYQKRIDMRGWVGEVFEAHMRRVSVLLVPSLPLRWCCAAGHTHKKLSAWAAGKAL